MAKFKWRVDTWEYERGFGRRPMGSKFFEDDDLHKAQAFVKEYNYDLNDPNYRPGYIPDTFLTADDPVRIQVG